MADNNTIARPYARAVFELARDEDDLAGWSDALAVATDLLADGQVVTFLARPALTDEQRLGFLTELFSADSGEASLLAGGNEQGDNFLRLLLEYDRVAVLPEIAEHFEVQKAHVENTVDVTVTSAAPMSAAQQEAVSKALADRLGRSVRLETAIDESLIGGAVIRAGDVVIDGSLRSRLEGLANALIS